MKHIQQIIEEHGGLAAVQKNYRRGDEERRFGLSGADPKLHGGISGMDQTQVGWLSGSPM